MLVNSNYKIVHIAEIFNDYITYLLFCF
jgi:hypothetical protein